MEVSMSAGPRLAEFGAVFTRLNSLYAGGEMRLLGGFSPYVSAGDAARSTFVARGRTVLSTSAGIAVDEMAFAYGLCEIVAPRRILVIGNSYGVSTVFFALVNPDATVVAIDKYRTVGISVTNELLSSERGEGRPAAFAIQASTPDDLEEVVEQHLDGGVDFVFVDAVHENDVQSAEFRLLAPLVSPGGAVVFHDVISCALTPSIEDLRTEFPEFDFELCSRTTTGMAVAFRCQGPRLADYLAFWSSEPDDVADFDDLMRSRWGAERAGYFRDVPTSLAFPPHPQL